MDRDLFAFDFFRGKFPKVDIRLIKATVLEHGDDIESALNYLKGIDNELPDPSLLQDARESCLSRTNSSRLDCNSFAIEAETAVCDDYSAPELSSSTNQVSLVSLEDIVEEAKNDKELVINLVKEVSNLRAKADHESIAASRAKSEAATSGECLLKKADEVCKEISQKKQENLLRMGEIYGEKAVLVTEERELRLRLEQLKLQKERALTALHEIQARLQDFYDAAVEEKNMAEEDSRVKAERAQKLLAEEEALMAEVEEESKKLDMEAEACIQVKESLAQYGSMVDSLQGEMSILTEDVESFKRQVEEGMWSSVSTASLSSNVNPEGPYTFRRCKLPSTASGKDLGQSFEALYSSRRSHSSRQSHSWTSASSSQGMSDSFSRQSNTSSQDFGKEVHHTSNVEEDVEWPYQLVNYSGSLSGGSRQDVTSNIMFSASSDVEGTPSRLDSMEMVKACPTMCGSNHLLEGGSWASLNGIAESGPEFTNPTDKTYYTSERLDYECVGGDWVITTSTKQSKDSRSSSSSSMVKIEADDVHSD